MGWIFFFFTFFPFDEGKQLLLLFCAFMEQNKISLCFVSINRGYVVYSVNEISAQGRVVSRKKKKLSLCILYMEPHLVHYWLRHKIKIALSQTKHKHFYCQICARNYEGSLCSAWIFRLNSKLSYNLLSSLKLHNIFLIIKFCTVRKELEAIMQDSINFQSLFHKTE